MGIDVYLENENGDKLEVVSDEKYIFAHLLEASNLARTICLRFVDPYGDATFNFLQAPLLKEEIEKLLLSTTEPTTLLQLQKIISLIEKCQSGKNLYIKFYGD